MEIQVLTPSRRQASPSRVARRRDRADVRAGVRLRQRERADERSGGHARQDRALLIFAAEQRDRRAARVPASRRRSRRGRRRGPESRAQGTGCARRVLAHARHRPRERRRAATRRCRAREPAGRRRRRRRRAHLRRRRASGGSSVRRPPLQVARLLAMAVVEKRPREEARVGHQLPSNTGFCLATKA